ncbi:MAG: hypothetical protein Q8L34_02640, partial [Candidatus Woesearchaeota archaeon]|nr:hypothetical protein [Candidatus Woesearchaeota archaeon]
AGIAGGCDMPSNNLTHALSTEGIIITEEVTKAYIDRGFGYGDIIALHRAAVSPQQADKYLLLNSRYRIRLDGYDIARLVRTEVPFAEVEAAARKHMVREAMK